jgi:hypothetical protein
MIKLKVPKNSRYRDNTSEEKIKKITKPKLIIIKNKTNSNQNNWDKI